MLKFYRGFRKQGVNVDVIDMAHIWAAKVQNEGLLHMRQPLFLYE